MTAGCYDKFDTMATTSEIIEENRVPASIGIEYPDSPDDLDATFRQVMRVVYATALTLQGVKAPRAASTSATARELADAVTDHLDGHAPEERMEHTRVLHEALRCGEALIDRDDVAALQRDFSQLDDETLQEVRETLGYVSDYYGIDLTLPLPEAGNESQTTVQTDGSSNTHSIASDRPDNTHRTTHSE